MNYENSQTYDPNRILLNLSRKDKYVALSNFSIYYTWKNIKKCKNLKYQFLHEMKS